MGIATAKSVTHLVKVYPTFLINEYKKHHKPSARAWLCHKFVRYRICLQGADKSHESIGSTNDFRGRQLKLSATNKTIEDRLARLVIYKIPEWTAERAVPMGNDGFALHIYRDCPAGMLKDRLDNSILNHRTATHHDSIKLSTLSL